MAADMLKIRAGHQRRLAGPSDGRRAAGRPRATLGAWRHRPDRPPEQLDRYVLALGDARIAIRRLELRVSPLESMFFALTTDDGSVDRLEPDEFAERVLTSA